VNRIQRAAAKWAVGAMIPTAGTALVAFLVIAATGVSAADPSPNGPPGIDGSVSCAASGAVANLDADQTANARAIAEVALHRNLGTQGVVMVEMVAFTESTLHNVPHGDPMGPSSRGLFQQMPSWGPESVRMDPDGSAGLFLDHLLGVSGWQAMPPWIAAQTVQGSEFDGKHVRNGQVLGFGDNYKPNLQIATSITAQLLTPAARNEVSVSTVQGCAPAGTAGAPPASGTVLVNGVTVTLPSGPDVDPAVAGKVIKAPTAALAKGLAAGFADVGLPYVYGGGTDGGGPDQGCSRAAGELNSCQGIIGFDCSGLTAYVLKQAGYTIPTNSSGQRTGGGQLIPRSRGLPGDIIGYQGHVAIYLGFIGREDYLLEAPEPGKNVHIRAAYWSNEGQPADADLHRFWAAA